jgi:hypothetical protein
MAIFQTLCSSFKQELFEGVHDFTADTFKLALYTANATLNADTTEYTTTNEVTDAAYTAGGNALTGATVQLSGSTAFVDFADTSWAGAVTARGGLIYNASKSDKAVAVLDFGSDKTSVNAFDVQMPAADASSALIKIT